MHILELLYQEQEASQFNWRDRDYKSYITLLFEQADSVIVDINDIKHVHMAWEKYHHNSIWCNFGVQQTMQEAMDNIQDSYIYPTMRIDVDLFRKAIQYERDGIPYECFLKWSKRKYIHVKLRSRSIDG